MVQFQIGDVIERDKGPIVHVGVYMGNGRVLHASPAFGGVAITSEADFANNESVRLRLRTSISPFLLFQRARALLAQRRAYDALIYNCEDLVEEVITGKRGSSALKVALLFLAAGVAVWATTR